MFCQKKQCWFVFVQIDKYFALVVAATDGGDAADGQSPLLQRVCGGGEEGGNGSWGCGTREKGAQGPRGFSIAPQEKGGWSLFL